MNPRAVGAAVKCAGLSVSAVSRGRSSCGAATDGGTGFSGWVPSSNAPDVTNGDAVAVAVGDPQLLARSIGGSDGSSGVGLPRSTNADPGGSGEVPRAEGRKARVDVHVVRAELQRAGGAGLAEAGHVAAGSSFEVVNLTAAWAVAPATAPPLALRCTSVPSAYKMVSVMVAVALTGTGRAVAWLAIAARRPTESSSPLPMAATRRATSDAMLSWPFTSPLVRSPTPPGPGTSCTSASSTVICSTVPMTARASMPCSAVTRTCRTVSTLRMPVYAAIGAALHGRDLGGGTLHADRAARCRQRDGAVGERARPEQDHAVARHARRRRHLDATHRAVRPDRDHARARRQRERQVRDGRVPIAYDERGLARVGRRLDHGSADAGADDLDRARRAHREFGFRERAGTQLDSVLAAVEHSGRLHRRRNCRLFDASSKHTGRVLHAKGLAAPALAPIATSESTDSSSARNAVRR